MTVKMTSARSRCVVFLMTFVMAQCVPLDFTTSRYSGETVELHDNRPLPLPPHSNSSIIIAPRIFDIANFLSPRNDEGRRSKSPRNQEFHSEELVRNLRTVNFKNDLSFFGNSTVTDDSRKFSNKRKSELYSNFERNGLKGIKRNKTQLNSYLYGNFVTSAAQKPGIFKIRVPKPTVTPKPTKFLNITRKPIIIKLTKVPLSTKPTRKTTRTPGWISKIKSTTPIPTSSTKSDNFGWPNTKIKNKNDWNRYKNYTQLNISKKPNIRKPSPTPHNRKKPTRVKYVPKRGHKPTLEEIKQNWYESGVPYPNPMPEINSNSPTFPLPPVEDSPTGEDLVQHDNPPTYAMSTFNLDMRPALNSLKDTFDAGSGCPTVHISSSVLSPQQRQECSDLNLVINSHFHQNTASDRLPSIDTYQAENPGGDVPVDAAEDPVEEGGAADSGPAQAESGPAQADPGSALADPGPAQAAQSDPGGGSSPGAGGTGGSGSNGGSGGNGGDGSNSGLGWPDIKGMLDAVDWIGNKFGHVFSFLKNPYLYLIPAALFFLIGFFLIFALFPWWVPLLFLLVGIKAKQKPNVAHHKHIHKPVHHPDGWFWNQNTKTWENLQDYLHQRRIDNVNLHRIPQAIDQFGKRYGFDKLQLKSIRNLRSLHFEPIEKSGNQLMELRKSSDDLFLDTRTPPKIRAQTKKKEKDDHMEFSHAGVAIPVDEESVKLEETTKKLNFYKIQRPTTNSGLSTWILLSGDSSTTTPKTMNVTDTKDDMKVIEVSGTRIVKPVFKKRTTTIRPTTSVSTQKTKGANETSTRKPKPPSLVKIKASTLNNAKKKNDSKTIGTSIKEVTEHPTEKPKVTLFNRLSTIKTTTTSQKLETSTLKSVEKTTTPASMDPQKLEAKEGDSNITESPMNKKKKNKTRKNKNKTRRKKPQEKTSNSTTTKVAKNKNHLKEKPLGTQIYNYLSREMMPTLGVGLVGLMVTAGLASYFLYPFGAARRIYEVDRKDKEGGYYYNDAYSGGIAEEEAFGKVIAGMPLEKLQSSMYSSTQTTRRPLGHKQNNYYPPQQNYANHQNHHKHHVPQNTKNYQNQPHNHNHNKQNGMVQGTVESVPLGPGKDSYLANSYNKDSYQLVNYKSNEVDPNRDSEVNMDQKFVVGNAPKGTIEEVTPAAVPEHGPRMLRLRRRRDVDDMENDIYSDKEITDAEATTVEFSTTDPPITTSTKSTTESLDNRVHSVVDLIKDIFHLKLSLGLELVKNATRSISNYIEKVQTKLDRHYRTSQKFWVR